MFRYILSGSECTLFTESSHQRFQSSLQKCSILKTTFLKQKQGSTTKKSEVSLINLALLYLVQPPGSRCTCFIESNHSSYFLKQKRRSATKKIEVLNNKFGILIPFSAIYFLEVGARISLKVATKGSSRGKKSSKSLDSQATFLNQMQRSKTIISYIFLIILELS